MEFVGVCHVPEAPFRLIADARVERTPVKALVDIVAILNFIRSDVHRKLVAASALRLNKGSLETAVGCPVNIDGWVTTNLKLESIDDDIGAFVVRDLKAGVIPGMRSLKEYECALGFHGESLWTGPKEGSIVPLHYEPLRTSVAVTPTQTDSFRGSRRSPAAYIRLRLSEGFDRLQKNHVVQAVSDMGENDLQAQAGRHLEEDVEKILKLAAPGVTGMEKDKLAELIRSHRDLFALTDALGAKSWGKLKSWGKPF